MCIRDRVYPAYVLERADGNNKFWSSLSALTWPVGLGKFISFHYFSTEKGNNVKDIEDIPCCFDIPQSGMKRGRDAPCDVCPPEGDR